MNKPCEMIFKNTPLYKDVSGIINEFVTTEPYYEQCFKFLESRPEICETGWKYIWNLYEVRQMTGIIQNEEHHLKMLQYDIKYVLNKLPSLKMSV